ncbi:hypothetical protein [Acidovorax sp. 106]|uniref:hypothetical protein n=1 Tax=Acidovorax sp. 106 TaxID=2135637 RepID=UPI00351A10D3
MTIAGQRNGLTVEVTVETGGRIKTFLFTIETKSVSPDSVFPKYRAALFVHGCFWHRHGGCRYLTRACQRGVVPDLHPAAAASFGIIDRESFSILMSLTD